MELQLYAEAIAVTVVLFYIFAIASAIEAILVTRTAQGAIAWTISLLTFPYLAVPLYLIFGRNKFDGYLEQRSLIMDASKRLLEQQSDAMEPHIVAAAEIAPWDRSLFTLARLPATGGNNIDLLIDGKQTFDSIAEGLRSATRYILFEFYIIRDDELGRRLSNIMIERAKAGIKVHIVFDEIGSRRFSRSKLMREMMDAGIKIAAFNTTQGRRNRFQLNFRNHRKIVVVDGHLAWIGGHNIGKEYLGLDKKIGHWRDTHVRLQGAAVLGAEIVFATDWRWAARGDIDVLRETRPLKNPDGDCNVLIFPSDPVGTYEEASLMYHQLIVSAQQRIWIASPYFVPDRAIISALQLAALRGVDVRIIIPDEPDGPFVAMANWSYTRELLAAGVKVCRYQGGFMHQKVVLMDDCTAGVGTANFDNRSFRLNFEITVLVHSDDFAKQVEAMLNRDFERSRRVTKQEISDKPIWFPLAMGIARLFSPVL